MNQTMYKTHTNVSKREVASKHGAAFEVALQEFLGSYDPNSHEATERIAEISRLLEVTSDNVDQVKDQNWFQRSWNTVSGENRKLSRINERNLLQVQMDAFYFLENLSEQNQLFMRAVHAALQRVEDNQIQNERLKAHLLRALRRIGDRLKSIEQRQSNLENQFFYHESVQSRSETWAKAGILFALGFSSFLASVLVWVLGTGTLGAGLSMTGIIGFGTVGVVCWGAAVLAVARGKNHSNDFATPSIYLESFDKNDVRNEKESAERAKENARARRTINRDLSNLLPGRYSQFASGELVMPFVEISAAVSQSYEHIASEEPTPAEAADWVGALLRVSPKWKNRAQAIAAEVAVAICAEFNELIGVVVGEHLEDRIGTTLPFELKRSVETALARELMAALEVFNDTADQIEDERKQLLNNYQKWRKLHTEHAAVSFAKDFAKGFFIVPALLDDTEEFIWTFHRDLQTLEDRWHGYGDTIDASLAARVETVIRGFSAGLIDSIDALLDECEKAELYLVDVQQTFSRYFEGAVSESYQDSDPNWPENRRTRTVPQFDYTRGIQSNSCPRCSRSYPEDVGWCPSCEVGL